MSIHIAATDVKKSYRKGKLAVPVLHGVELEADHGELVAIVGARRLGQRARSFTSSGC